MKLSIVIPCYNEASVIKEHVATVLDFLKGIEVDYELIVVNDGSKDNTGEIIETIPGIIPVNYSLNKGKGGAVKEGIKASTGDYVIFMDADLSTDLNAIKTTIPLLKEGRVIIASRKLKESVLPVKRKFKRRLISWICKVLVNLRFHLHVSDSQCGFKAFDKNFAKEIINHQIIERFAFDVEYLYMAKLNGLEIKEIPVTWTDDYRSSVVPMRSGKEFVKALGKIKKNKKNYYFSK